MARRNLVLTDAQLEAFKRSGRARITAGGPRRPGVRVGAESPLEVLFEQQLRLSGVSGYEREHKHIPKREYRLDFAWPHVQVGVEIQGRVHRIKARFQADLEKRALSLLAGWRVLEVGRVEIQSGAALRWLEALLAIASRAGVDREARAIDAAFRALL